ncbi:MAG: cytochrome P450 [Acidimicrobiia bacterium]
MSVEYDPFSPQVMADPYPVYRALRAAHRVYPLPEYDAWALTRFDDVWRVLADRDRFTITEGPVFRRDQVLHHNHGKPPAPAPVRPVPSFSTLDAPVHTVLRKAMLEPFRPGAVNALAPTVRAIARDRLDELGDASTFDVRHDYAAPVAAAVAAHQLGFRVEDARALVALVNRSVRRAPGQAGATEDGLAARREMGEFFVALVADRRRAGRPHPHHQPLDALDGLLACTVPDERGAARPLDDAEIADQISTLFVGGSETLPKVLAGAAYELWRAPTQRDVLVADPARVPHAFEEALRHDLPLQFIGRTLTVDAEIAGVPMRAGQRVVLLLICANRDEHEFADPEQFDAARFARGDQLRTLGLGHGVHVCIGAHIARLEGAVMLGELLARHPRYEVDDTDLRRDASEFHVSWAEMPIFVG